MKRLVHYCCLVITIVLVSCGGADSGDEIIPPTPVQTVDPPTSSTLSRPTNNEVCEEGTSVSDTQNSVNFQWIASSNTDSYDIKIINLDNNQVINQTNILQTNKVVTLDKGTPYSWKVISRRYETNVVAESETWKFYLSREGVSNYPPYPSSLVSPTSGHIFPSDTSEIELIWQGSHPENLTMTYDLFIDSTDGLQAPNPSNENLTSESKTVQVTSGNSYYWRVKSKDPNENSSYSIIYTFRVE